MAAFSPTCGPFGGKVPPGRRAAGRAMTEFEFAFSLFGVLDLVVDASGG
jgi:hypothetical protein